ncbi:MAG: DUF1289 domain-containing protein [Porticoccaceae bacterium]|nr:DUF1289 domain-containing protein [Porticoccaceae bacterium]
MIKTQCLRVTTLADIASPCVRNCCLNEEDICLGCFRSLDEILTWRAASNKQRQAVLDLTLSRRDNHRRKYLLARGSKFSDVDSKFKPDKR